MVTANTKPEPLERDALIKYLSAKISELKETADIDDYYNGLVSGYENILSLILTGKEG